MKKSGTNSLMKAEESTMSLKPESKISRSQRYRRQHMILAGILLNDGRGRHKNHIRGEAHHRWRGGNPRPILERCRENAKQSRQRHRLKARARTAVRDAIRRGILPKAKTQICIDCSKPAKAYDHPRGYERAHYLDVEPVCFICHGRRSRERGEYRLNGRRRVTPSLKDGPRPTSGGRLLDGKIWDKVPT